MDNTPKIHPTLFGPAIEDEIVPPPGTEGNEWIGYKHPHTGVIIPYSGAQRRRIRRAAERRQAAEIRVSTKRYAKNQADRARYEAFVQRRTDILTGAVDVSPGLLNNVLSDQKRRHDVTEAFKTKAERRHAAGERREDRLDERRIARFKAGKPRGKDLREETFKQYSSFLPPSYWRDRGVAGGKTNRA